MEVETNSMPPEKITGEFLYKAFKNYDII